MIDSVWNRSLFRPLLIATLVTALMAGPVAIGQAVAPQWQAGYLLPLLFLVALEAVYTTTWLVHPDHRQRRTIGFRLAELVVWLVIVRLLLWMLRGNWPQLYDLWRWLRAPISFFDREFVIVGVLVAVAWAEGISNGGIFQQLALQPDELADPPTGHDQHDWRPLLSYTTSRTAILARFSGRWMLGGVFLVLCAAASRLKFQPGAGLRLFGLAHLDLSPLMIAALVVYILTGLLLMSLGRLAALRARWRIDKIEGEHTVTRRWPLFTLLLVLIVGGLSALMPLGSTWRLGYWLQIAVLFISNLAYTVVGYILWLLTTLLGLLLSALGLGSEAVTGERIQFEPPQLPEQPLDTARELPEWLGGALFWLLMAIIVVYALVTFLRGRGVRLEWGRLSLFWVRLRAWWRRWRRGVREAAQGVRKTLAERWARRRPEERAGRPGRGFLPWRQLSPQERVRLFYLFTVRRAEERGVHRQPHQTPYEHTPALEAGWPDVEEELEALTQAFVVARYSARAIAPDEVQGVRRAWKRVRSALRHGRRGAGESDTSSCPKARIRGS